jgi:gluconate 5-dehydrogenase
MSALFDLASRTALITGAATEVGLAIASALADAGARVVVNGRDPLKAEAVVQCIGVYRARTCCFDVTDEEAVAHSVDKLERAGWPVDILVNNAGGSASAVLVSQIVSNRMITRGTGGKIITIGDNSVRALTRALAAECAQHGINVNALAAGSTGAPAPDGEREQWVTHRDQTQCWTRSDDLRGPAVFLASAASDHVNGQLLHVGDGPRSCA